MKYRGLATALCRLGLALPLLLSAATARPAWAANADFPPVTEEERKLTAVPGETMLKAVKIDSRLEGERTLVYNRRFDLPHPVFNTSQDYEAVRSLFGELEKSDAQTVLLVHR